MPNVCRRVVCEIGGHAEAREAVQQAQVRVLVSRVRVGVLAYGRDADVRKAFGAHGITEFDLHAIDSKRLRYESGERGLLREALSLAIARCRHLEHTRRRSADLFRPLDVEDPAWAPLRRLVSPLSGIVEGFADLRWREGIGTRLDWADDRLWLLVEPRIVFDGLTDDNRAAATGFAREKTVKRYNRILNDLVGFWASVLAGTGDELRALDISDGVEAVFTLSADTAFSRRAGA